MYDPNISICVGLTNAHINSTCGCNKLASRRRKVVGLERQLVVGSVLWPVESGVFGSEASGGFDDTAGVDWWPWRCGRWWLW